MSADHYYGGPPPNHGFGQSPMNQPPYQQHAQQPYGGSGGPPPFPQGPALQIHQQPGGYGGYQQQGFAQGPSQQGGYSGFQQQSYDQQPPQMAYAAPASLGYDLSLSAQGDASQEADGLRAAMKGFGTDEETLVRILSRVNPLRMTSIRNTYSRRFNRSLEEDVKKETSGHFREGLLALVRGPLVQDVNNVYSAIKGLGTKESMLNDVLLGRSNADLRAIKHEYHHRFGNHLEADVKGDLSLKTEKLFTMVMAATRDEESAPIIPQEIDRDVADLHAATEGRGGTDQITVCSIIASRSDGQLRTIAQQFEQRYHIRLEKVLEKHFSGHMQDALLLMLGRATDPAMTAAMQLEDTMKGAGTRDSLLVNRVVRTHWDRTQMDQVKRAYAFRFKRDLIARVQGETSRHEQKLLVACLS